MTANSPPVYPDPEGCPDCVLKGAEIERLREENNRLWMEWYLDGLKRDTAAYNRRKGGG